MLHAIVVAEKVRLDHIGEGLGRRLVQRYSFLTGDSRVVKCPVYAPELLNRALNQRLNLRLFAHIAIAEVGLASSLANHLDGLLPAGLVEVGNHYLRAFGGKEQRRRAAYSARTACDYSGPVVQQFDVHVQRPFRSLAPIIDNMLSISLCSSYKIHASK